MHWFCDRLFWILWRGSHPLDLYLWRKFLYGLLSSIYLNGKNITLNLFLDLKTETTCRFETQIFRSIKCYLYLCLLVHCIDRRLYPTWRICCHLFVVCGGAGRTIFVSSYSINLRPFLARGWSRHGRQLGYARMLGLLLRIDPYLITTIPSPGWSCDPCPGRRSRFKSSPSLRKLRWALSPSNYTFQRSLFMDLPHQNGWNLKKNFEILFKQRYDYLWI